MKRAAQKQGPIFNNRRQSVPSDRLAHLVKDLTRDPLLHTEPEIESDSK